MPRFVQVAKLFGLGAFIGTAADQIHVRSGVLSYPRPSALLPGQPLWVPLLFGAAGVALPLANAAMLRATRERPPRSTVRGLAAAVLWFFAAYASTALFQAESRALAIALVSVWAARVALRPTPDELLAGPLFALGGALFEAGLSSTGAFQYRAPDFLLVPAWLPALYLHVSLMTREACLAFLGRGRDGGRRADPPARTAFG
ncbi:MAG TPA: hypothetical protein VM683_06190 [Anaeromyxobacteraceae bacterium]|jgi:hypothetical protein|nr:hypothetical protein [Anaeromyxobacteraceae bacterium]